MGKLLGLVLLATCCQAAASQLVVRMHNQDPKLLTQQHIESQFEATTLDTTLPWFDGSKTFTGFKVSSLLDHYRINDAFSLSFIALNDYAASSRIEDILQYEPIVAYQMNGNKMKVRDKGPYWLIFNLTKYPELNTPAYHSQMVWQIDEIMIHRRSDNE